MILTEACLSRAAQQRISVLKLRFGWRLRVSQGLRLRMKSSARCVRPCCWPRLRHHTLIHGPQTQAEGVRRAIDAVVAKLLVSTYGHIRSECARVGGLGAGRCFELLGAHVLAFVARVRALSE